MKDFEPAELSAFLDGELDAAAAERIKGMIASDPEVRAAFEQLSVADHHLRIIAQDAAFWPRLQQSRTIQRGESRWLLPPLAAILLAWMAGKVMTTGSVSFLINAVALALFVALLAPLALREARDPEAATVGMAF